MCENRMLKMRVCGKLVFLITTEKRKRFCMHAKTDESGGKRTLHFHLKQLVGNTRKIVNATCGVKNIFVVLKTKLIGMLGLAHNLFCVF